MKYETRVMDREEAKAFIQNMRWFADRGNIRATRIGTSNYFRVRASKMAWSYWVEAT